MNNEFNNENEGQKPEQAPAKRKLQLKKTTIAKLTMSDEQMRMIWGGVEEPIIKSGNFCDTSSVVGANH